MHDDLKKEMQQALKQEGLDKLVQVETFEEFLSCDHDGYDDKPHACPDTANKMKCTCCVRCTKVCQRIEDAKCSTK